MEQYVKICPKCKSVDVSMDNSNPLQGAVGLPAVYVCNDCGHQAYAFPEVLVDQLESFEKEVTKEKLVDKSLKDEQPLSAVYGNFFVRVMWKIIGPILVIIGLIFIYLDKPGSVNLGIICLILGLILSYFAYFKKRKIVLE